MVDSARFDDREEADLRGLERLRSLDRVGALTRETSEFLNLVRVEVIVGVDRELSESADRSVGSCVI